MAALPEKRMILHISDPRKKVNKVKNRKIGDRLIIHPARKIEFL